MDPAKWLGCIAAPFAFVFVPAYGAAGDNCFGQEVIIGSKHVIVNNDPDVSGLPKIGECSSWAVGIGGSCNYTDKDGDESTVEWKAVPGTSEYTWRSTGGTGKWATATGSGWGNRVMSDGSVTVNRWGGECR